ncbi:hypothetical protein ACFW9F_17010 [Streptomyces sp. NPDC059506]|uniref:hypothetical protein n=1 Tax=Streptomyces sp. NPDC059506 TaxID=3347751 RepID=UPI0036977A46
MLIAAALAGTIFFSVPVGEARGRVALYLVVTMAPFVLLAPVIGPLLDRLPHGRRAAVAVSMLARAVLAWAMAGSVEDAGLELYPAALGVLVASKGYGVVRSAVVPRLLPSAVTLVRANSRVTLAGLVATGLAAPVGALLHLLGPAWPLYGALAVFSAGALLAFSLPHAVDSARGEERALLRSDPEPDPGSDPEPGSGSCSPDAAPATAAGAGAGAGASPVQAAKPSACVPAGTAPDTSPAAAGGAAGAATGAGRAEGVEGGAGPTVRGAGAAHPTALATSTTPTDPTTPTVPADPAPRTDAAHPASPAPSVPPVGASALPFFCPLPPAAGIAAAAGPAAGAGVAGGPGAGAVSGRARRRPGLRTVGPSVLHALRANAALRAFSGLLTLFLAFLLRERPPEGLSAAVALGLVAVAAAAGNALGTTLGAWLRARGPETIITAVLGLALAAALPAAALYGAVTLAVVAAVAGLAQALAKLSLDALIQRDVPEEVRTSAFARSETALQLSWVVGGGLGIVLPLNGTLGLAVAAALVAVAAAATTRGLVRAARRGAPYPRAA